MNIQKIGDRTAELLNLYYNNEIEPFLNSCHEDVLWIGPADKQVIRGRKNLVDAFHAEKHELKFSLNNLTVLPLATTSSTVPLRYNNDKQKKPLFSRGLSVCRLLFNSFSKLKIDENYKEKRRLFY